MLPQTLGRYEVLAELGRGAMGTVYKARDTILEREVAIKVMSEGLDLEAEMMHRFEREAKSAANLQHPNIVTIYDFGGVQGGRPYIVMELLAGDDLAALMDGRKLGSLADKLRITAQICRGLDYAHKLGVVHRDVKPGNVQVLPNGTVKILDFGIAWREGSSVKTRTGLVMGTPTYMAPEQITSANADHRADLWAVGVILYEMLAGRRPFEAPTIPGLIYSIVHSVPPPLDPRKTGLPEGLVAIVNRALQKNADDRYRDLAEMEEALENLLRSPGAPTAALPSWVAELERARALLERGEAARALEACRRAQVLEPGRPEVEALKARIEAVLRQAEEEPTVMVPPSSPAPGAQISPDPDLEGMAVLEAERRVDDARMALTRGERTVALRITEDVLSRHPSFKPAQELKDLLATPPAPGRVRTDRSRTYTRSEIRMRGGVFRKLDTLNETVGLQVIAVAPQEHLLAVGGVDGAIRLWDLERRSRLDMLRSGLHRRAGHEGLVTTLAFSSDGAYLASGHVDGVIHVWDLESGHELKARLGHDGAVGAVAFSPDGTVIASGGADATVKLWDVNALRAGEARRRFFRQPAPVTCLAHLGEGRFLVTGHTNRVLRIQDSSTGRPKATLRGHDAPPSSLAVSPDGSLLASGARDGGILVFNVEEALKVDVPTEGRALRHESRNRSISSLAFFPDNEVLAGVAMDETLSLWSVGSGIPETLAGNPGERFASVAVFAQGQQLACGLADGRVRLWIAGD